MNQFYTYLHCRLNGTPFYVGKGSSTRAYDFWQRSAYHKRIVAKYGRENIRVYIFPCTSEEQAFADEIQQIIQLRSEGYVLANHTDGGEGPSGMRHTEAAKLQISVKLKHRLISPETKQRLSKAKKGKPFSAEHCANISRAKLGAPHKIPRSLEHAKKLSQVQKGRRPSPQTIAAVIAANRGRKLSPEHKQKIATGVQRARAKMKKEN